MQEVEERGVAELEPAPARVEVGQGHQELAERGALAREEVGEPGGEIACGVHFASIARVFEPSPNARIRVRTREREEGRSEPPFAQDAAQAR